MAGVKTEITALTLFNSCGVGKKPTRASLVAACKKAIENEKTSTWRTAVTVYKTVKNQNFEALFESKADYAECIGYKESYVTRLVRTVDMYLMLVHLDYTFEKVTVGFVMELLPLCGKDIDGEIVDDFLHVSELKATDNRDTVRKKVKEYRGLCTPDETTGNASSADESTGNTSSADESIDNAGSTDESVDENVSRETFIILEFDGNTINIPKGDMYDDIMNVLLKHGVTV